MTEALALLAEQRIVPVLTASSADEAGRACEALLAGGLAAVEITFRTDAAAEAIRRAATFDGLLVGAGTVITPEQLERAAEAGARFAVAPGMNEDVVAAARDAGIPFIPGVATPTEIERGLALGCEALKLFPASLAGGAAFVQAVAPVYPAARFVPTGGVNAGNVGDYLRLPAVLACAGTWICDRELLREGRLDEVERRAREAVGLARAVAAA